MFNSQIRDLERIANDIETRNMQNPTYAEFIKSIKSHDYSYMMSDSHQVWLNGRAEEKHIEELIAMLIADGLKPQYLKSICKSNVTDFLDKDSNGDGLSYRVINGWFKQYIN